MRMITSSAYEIGALEKTSSSKCSEYRHEGDGAGLTETALGRYLHAVGQTFQLTRYSGVRYRP